MNKISLSQFMKQCSTGDLILLSSTNLLSSIIQKTTQSQFEHVSFILKDVCSKYKGIHILDISIFECVKITPLRQFLKMHKKTNTTFCYKKIKKPKQFRIDNKILLKVLRYLQTKKYNYKHIFRYLFNMKTYINYKQFTCCNVVIFIYIYLKMLSKYDYKHLHNICPKYFSYYENKNSLPIFSIPELQIMV